MTLPPATSRWARCMACSNPITRQIQDLYPPSQGERYQSLPPRCSPLWHAIEIPIRTHEMAQNRERGRFALAVQSARYRSTILHKKTTNGCRSCWKAEPEQRFIRISRKSQVEFYSRRVVCIHPRPDYSRCRRCDGGGLRVQRHYRHLATAAFRSR